MNISRQPNGRYRAKFKIGRQQISSKTCDTLKEARAWYNAQKVLYIEGYDPGAGKRTPIEQALNQFLTDLEGSVSESTMARDRSALRRFSNALLKRPIGEVSRAELTNFLKANWKTAGSRNRAKTSLSAFLSWAVKVGYRKNNPVRDIKLASGSARAMSPMTVDLIEEIAAAVEQPEYRRAIRVLGYTGLRWGELRALKVGDVHNGRLHVTRSWSEGYNEKDVKQHQERWVPILDAIAHDIEAAISGRNRDERMFLSPKGRLINSRNLRRDVKWAKKAPGYRLHDLRHSAITNWVIQGVDVGTVRQWAGHDSLKTTNRYLHATGVGERDAVRRLNENWRGSAGGRAL